MTSAGRCAMRTTWKVEFGGLFLYHVIAPAHTPLSECVNCWLKANDCQLMGFNLFLNQDGCIKASRCNDINRIQGKLWDTLAQFQAVHFTYCHEQWDDHWTHFIEY
jgi:hypothetical protein